MEKEIYQLKKEDFIPFIGRREHTERCLNEMIEHPFIHGDHNYIAKCFARDVLLVFYNTTIISGTFAGALDLVHLLSK